MKKLLTILLILISFSSFAQFEAGEFVNSDTAKIKGSSIIYPHADSVEQFYYSKMRDPSEPLDGVNLRTLFDRLASLDTLGLNVSDLVSGAQLINTGETQIFFPSAFDSTNVIVVPFVRRISDDAVIDFTINDIDSLGFDVVVWEDGCKIQYVASQKITHSSDIFKEPIYSADSGYLKSHVIHDFDLDSTNEIQDLSGLVPFSGADRDVELGANSISTDTVKLNGVPLLLNTFKQGNLGGASNIFYSTGASSQPASGSLNQVVGGNALTPNYLTKWDGEKLANSVMFDDGANVAIGLNSSLSAKFTVYNANGLSNIRIDNSLNTLGAGGSQFQFFANASQAQSNRKNFAIVNANSLTIGGNNSLSIQTRNDNGSFNNTLAIFEHGRFATVQNNAYGLPQTSGTDQIYGAFRIKSIGSVAIDYGMTNSPVLAWIQGTSTANLSINVPLILNPNGGYVGINKTDPSEALDVNGDIAGDTVKVNKDLIVTGEIYNEINHLYAMVYDSTIVTTLTKDVWQQVTNATKTLYSTAEQDGITVSGDTIVFSKEGGYDVYFEFNNIGIDKKEYHYRILQKNGSTVVRSYNKYASTGIQQVRNEKAYIQVEAGAKVWCEIMSPSPVPGDVTIQGAKAYAMQRYLIK